ncbi:RNA12 protein-domain-containing protein [Aspergillus alliaceus]|uniref:Mitochondrial escape protein 2 n=1 Tax=Petromyces alliaceus TaxID=209559 RepID=A0A5N7BS37_PETAA|nr:RNA12 protein-domain-containing protein [Aspergillus alliaceus]
MDDGVDGVDSGDSEVEGGSCNGRDPLLMSPSKLASSCLNSASACSSRVSVRGCDGGVSGFSGAGLKPSAACVSSASYLETGHIELRENEGLFFVNNIFPPKLHWILEGPLRASRSYEEALKRIDRPHLAASDPLRIIRRVFPKELDVDIREVIPRFREGGAFVKYTRKEGVKDTDIETAIKHNLKEHPIRPWFNPFQQVKLARVLGRPWVEDLYRIPSPRLRVEFLPGSTDNSATDLTTETLYSLFRSYGKLKDIEKQSSESKITPRYAYVEFARSKYAVTAKNCMHGFNVPEQEGGGKPYTRLKINYERKIKLSMIKDWILSHPRIVIPTLAALIAAITVAIFDPIRTFFIKMKIKATLQIEENSVLRWIRKQVSRANIMGLGYQASDPRGLTAIWEDRQEDISQLQSWLMEDVETFIVIHGPRGSGKRELVLDQALKNYKYKVVIDCKQIQDARGDTAKIARAASQVGYRPVFSWMNSISSFIDLAAQGMIGTKAGFSETLDAQLSNIWQNTATALKKVTLDNRKKSDKDAHLTDEEYLEAHPELRPVVVIDNFLHNNTEDNVVHEKITEWAAGLTNGNIAHVIFLTTDVSFAKPLSKVLSNSVLRTISLGDCSPEVGRRFVLNHLADDARTGDKSPKNDEDLEDLDICIEILGGRVTDLEFMAHRIEAGETPRGAVNRIIEQSTSEILKMFILSTDVGAQWSHEQVWHLIRMLANAKDGSLPYDQVLLSDLFKENGEAALQALEQAELISIGSVNGCPETVKPGKPVYRAVFRKMTQNRTLSSRLDLEILSHLISKENKSIGKYEEELRLLGSLPKQPRELTARVQWLLQKVYNSQNKISKYEAESAMLQKILQNGLIQSVWNSSSGLVWPLLTAVLVFCCIATRITSGFRSRVASKTEKPQSVRTVPYWLPWLGHSASFMWNHVSFTEKARDYMNASMFGIYMGGTTYNTIVSPSMIESVMLSRVTSSVTLINRALKAFGDDLGSLRNLGAVDHHTFHHKLPNLLMREPFITDISTTTVQLLKREIPNFVTFCRSVVDQTLWERGSDVDVVDDNRNKPACEVNLFALVRGFIGNITTTTLMGQAVLEVFPNLLDDVWILDTRLPLLMIGIPRWVPIPGVSAAYAARDRLLNSLAAYHQAFLQWDDGVDPGVNFRDLDDVSEPLKRRIRTSKSLGLTPRSSAVGHLSLLWAMNVNSSNIAFWHLVRLYADPTLLEEIRKEISPYVQAHRPSREETGFPFQEPPRISIDLEGLLKSCALLKASFYETLRLDSADMSVRELTSDLTIEEDATLSDIAAPRTYQVRKGESVILHHGVLQNDSRYFSNPDQFDPLRFIITDPVTGKKNANMHTINPFGGGMSGCKGRAFAERQLLAFAAAMICMWDIEPMESSQIAIPRHRQSSGAYLPEKDIRVRIVARV